jgi:O-antigen/teichoic acid export membrane protein
LPIAEQERTVLRNSAFLVVAEILRRLFSLVMVLLIARSLGVEGFGRYAFVLAFVALFAGLAEFGLDTLLIKDVARHPERGATHYGSTLVLKLGTSALAAGLTCATVAVLSYPAATTRAVYIMATASIFYALVETASALCKALQRMEYSALISIARSVLLIPLVLFVLWRGGGLVPIVTAYLGSAVLLFGLSMIVVTARVVRPSFALAAPFLRTILRNALPFVVVSGIYMLGHRLDILMLSKMAGDAAVGLYTSAYTPVETILTIPALLTQALFPALSQSYHRSFEALRALAMRSLRIFLALALPMSAGIAVLAPQILDLMFSEEFDLAVIPLRIFGAMLCVFFLQVLLGWVLTAMDRLRWLIGINLVTVAVNVFLNVLLIPAYGPTGAALALAVSAVTGLTLLVAVLQRLRVVSLAGLKLPRIVLGTAAIAAGSYLLRDFNVFLVVAAGGALYVVVLWAGGIMDRDERDELRTLVRSALGRLRS